MSAKMTGMVFDRYHAGGGEMLLALALADHAHEDGTHIFPSVARLAAKTRQSERTIQYQLRAMQASGWLVLVNFGTGGRMQGHGLEGRPREYRINPEWIKGANFAPLKNQGASAGLNAGQGDDTQVAKGANSAPLNDAGKGANGRTKGCNPTSLRVQKGASKGATAIAPEPRATKSNQEQHTPRVGEAPGMTAADIDREVSPLGALPDNLDREVLAQFVRHRRVLNRTLSVQGWLQILPTLKSIAAAGGDPNQSLRDAMAAGLSLPVIPKSGANVHGNHPQGSAAGVSELRAEYERRHGGGSAGRPSGAGRGPQAGEVIDGEYAVVG